MLYDIHTSSNLSIKRHLKLKPLIHPLINAWYRSYRIDHPWLRPGRTTSCPVVSSHMVKTVGHSIVTSRKWVHPQPKYGTHRPPWLRQGHSGGLSHPRRTANWNILVEIPSRTGWKPVEAISAKRLCGSSKFQWLLNLESL